MQDLIQHAIIVSWPIGLFWIDSVGTDHDFSVDLIITRHEVIDAREPSGGPWGRRWASFVAVPETHMA